MYILRSCCVKSGCTLFQCVQGSGIRTTPGLAHRLFRAVQPANVEVISQGASAINMTFVVREADGPGVVRRLHQEVFGSC